MTMRDHRGLTLLIGLVSLVGVALYALSVGPAWMICCRKRTPGWVRTVNKYVYGPIWFAYGFGPAWLAKVIARWLRRWGPWNSAGL